MNVSYFYLKNELGLSETALWRVMYEASSALAMSTAVIRHKVQVLRETMDLSDENVRTILEQFPAILHLSADKNIAPTLLYLLRSLELGRDELRQLVVELPALLSYSRTNLQSKIGFFTSIMNYSVKDTRELFLREPKLLRASVSTGLVPRMQFLVQDVELPMESLRAIVKKNPRILLYSVESNLLPKLVYYLLMKLQMTTEQVEKFLLSFPQFLDYNLERTIQPTTQYFIEDLEFGRTEFATILIRFPRLFTVSLRKIKHSVGYFRFEMYLSPSQVKRILLRTPALLGFNADSNIKPKVHYLQHAMDLSEEQTRQLIASMPSLLGLSIENNLQPKLDFLKSSLGVNNNNNSTSLLRDVVLRLPALLGYSLNHRIRPRMEAILDADLDATRITVGIPMSQTAFESWLRNRQDADVRQRTVFESATKEASAPGAPSSLASSNNTVDASGRIVHWTRERRPRPDVQY